MWFFFWPSLAFTGATLAALAVRWGALHGLRRWGASAPSVAAFVAGVRVPSLLWCLVLGLHAAVEASELSPRLGRQAALLLQVAVIASVTVTVAGIVRSLIGRASELGALGGRVTGLAQTAARIAILLVGGLVVLSALGIQITPILTALGVGGLAVALALQDTLANLFAGMHLLADRPIRVGDYVKLSDGAEGFVVDVGWRSTRLRGLQNHIVVVPNQTVARSVITNYDLPEPRTMLQLRVAVGYDADADQVEAALLDEASRAVGEVAGLIAEPKPVVRLTGFGDAGLEFVLVCHVASYMDQPAVQHELRKRILRRFRAEGLAMACPVRVLDVRGPAAPAPMGGS